MIAFLTWYLSILILGWLVFPFAYRLLPFLPERGYTLSKALGLLLWGYAYWLLASLHIIQNDGGGILLSLLLLGGAFFALVWKKSGELRAWLTDNLRVVITSEAVFLAAFAFWAVVRAAAPEAAGTEKPMELAFVNAILRSVQFPPHDPWLSGYAISYYYFGYVMVAMLSLLNNLPGEVGFNLGVASWFGLTAVTSYGLLYCFIELRGRVSPAVEKIKHSASLALLAPLFILCISNANGLLEVLHSSGFLWEKQAGGNSQSGFWSWLDIQELTTPPAEPYQFAPNRMGGIWWWRSSRVLTDYDLNGAPREVIDEFPAFSFVLGDLHPHVLAMPFALLAIGLALNLYLRTRRRPKESAVASIWLTRADFWLAVVVLGGLAFLNTWDFPIYVGLYCGAYLISRVQAVGWSWVRVRETAYLGVLLGMAGIVTYIPFYTGFSSQAGGILPSLSFFTRGVHFWVMFATLLLPILFWLWHELPAENRRRVLLRGLGWGAMLVFGVWLLSYLLGVAMFAIPGTAQMLQGIQGGVEPFMALLGSLAKRLAQPGMWLSMLGILSLMIALTVRELRLEKNKVDYAPAEYERIENETQPDPVLGFLLLLALLGCVLVIFPEYFYLRDQFGWRMNTIFKFYFQVWILWGLLAAYASAWLWNGFKSRLAVIPRTVWSLLVISGLIFISFGVLTRTQNFKPAAWSLDGADYVANYQPADYQAILWLKQAPDGVVAEAVGGSYSDYARVATLSGLPNVIGWPGHESQWRGGMEEAGNREKEIELVYTVPDWETAREIIDRYNIRYIFIGSMEYGKYRVQEEKFQQNMALVYDANSVKIYEAPANLYLFTEE